MAQNDELLQPWATGVWESLGSPSNTSTSTISGFAVQPGTLGRLNDLVGQCFSGSGYVGPGTSNYQIGPYISSAELAIIGQLYLISFYNNLAMASMGLGGSNLPWLALAEGDSKIARVNAANIGKEYREMSKTAYEQLWSLCNVYRGNSEGGNIPRNVQFLNPPLRGWGQSYTWPG